MAKNAHQFFGAQSDVFELHLQSKRQLKAQIFPARNAKGKQQILTLKELEPTNK